MSTAFDEAEVTYEQFQAALGRAIERTVAGAERLLGAPEVAPAEVFRVAGQLILLDRLRWGCIPPVDLVREYFPPA